MVAKVVAVGSVVLSLAAAAMAAQEVRVATEVWADLVLPDLTVKHRVNQAAQVDKVVTAAPVASVEQVDQEAKPGFYSQIVSVLMAKAAMAAMVARVARVARVA